MADTFVGPKIEQVPGGDELIVKSGGTLTIATGGAVSGNILTRRMLAEGVPSGTAGVASGVRDQIFAPSVAITIRAVSLLPAATCAGHATSNFVLSLRNLGTGATGSTDCASITLTTGNALAANVVKQLTVSTTGGASVAAGEALVYYHTLASSGIDYPAGTLCVEYSVDS